MELLPFQSDYMEGAHPSILKKLAETNFLHTAGYGSDEFSEEARTLIKKACGAPNAEIQILTGGTQTNMTVIDCLLKKWQGVIAADTGHVSVHEAGAIEYTGHKVLLRLNRKTAKLKRTKLLHTSQIFTTTEISRTWSSREWSTFHSQQNSAHCTQKKN